MAKPMNAQWTLGEQYVDSPEFDDAANHVTGIGQRGDDWMAEAIRQLQAIEGLPAGWDSRGGGRPDAPTVRNAQKLLLAMAIADASLTKPHIHPTPSGGVQFHWECGPRYFEIELIDPRSAQFYFVDRQMQTEAEGQLHLGDLLDEVVGFAHRVRSEP